MPEFERDFEPYCGAGDRANPKWAVAASHDPLYRKGKYTVESINRADKKKDSAFSDADRNEQGKTSHPRQRLIVCRYDPTHVIDCRHIEAHLRNCPEKDLLMKYRYKS